MLTEEQATGWRGFLIALGAFVCAVIYLFVTFVLLTLKTILAGG